VLFLWFAERFRLTEKRDLRDYCAFPDTQEFPDRSGAIGGTDLSQILATFFFTVTSEQTQNQSRKISAFGEQ
jgi:hypothetical protein